MTLVHVSMSNASANAGTLDIGESTDTDGYKDGVAFGVSGACTKLATTEGMDPDPKEALTATMELNAGRAEKSLLQALKDTQ